MNFETKNPSKVDSLVAQARALRPLLRENAEAGEQLRSMPAEVEGALREMGAFTMITPVRWGGAGLSMADYTKVMIELGAGDLSAAWVVQLLNSGSWLCSLGSDEFQETIFADGPMLCCTAGVPPGEAKKVPGGYIVNGSWGYASGCRQADWAMGVCKIVAEDGTVSPPANMAFMPMSEIEIASTWFVVGMQGTGSDSIVAKDVFVPDHLMITAERPLGYEGNRTRHIGEYSDRMLPMPMGRTTNLSLLIGGARAMHELIRADVLSKPMAGTIYALKADSAVVVQEIGLTQTLLDNAELLLNEGVAKLDRFAVDDAPWSTLDLSLLRSQNAQIVTLLHDAIERIMFLGGSSAFALANPLQRFWRDIHVAIRHLLHIPRVTYEIRGREVLGITPNISPMIG